MPGTSSRRNAVHRTAVPGHESKTAPSPQHPTAGATRFFGRRKGHRLRPHQAALIEELLPRLAIDLGARPPRSRRAVSNIAPDDVLPRDRLRRRRAPRRSRPAAHPATGFIGCEPFVNGMAKILALIEATGIANIRLYVGDASRPLALAARSLARAASICSMPIPGRSGGTGSAVSCRTTRVANSPACCGRAACSASRANSPDYVAWTLERLMRSPQFAWTAERADDWRLPWPGFTRTRYEAKAARRPGAVLSGVPARRIAHIPAKACPDLIRGGYRFADKDMRPRVNWSTSNSIGTCRSKKFSTLAHEPIIRYIASRLVGHLITVDVIRTVRESGPRPGPALFYYLRAPRSSRRVQPGSRTLN